MSAPHRVHFTRRPPRLAYCAVLITAALCAAALLFRAPARSRYWAWRIARTPDVAQRAAFLGGLCSLRDDARWGTAALLAAADPALRECGVLVLHHLRSPWAHARLLDALTDPDPGVQRLAATGLAFHGDDAVVPALKWQFQTGDAGTAAMACLALERLGSSDAIAALVELTYEPAAAAQQAALVDALADIAAPACVPGLVRLLDDERVCPAPSRAAAAADQALAALQARGYARSREFPTTVPAAPDTIAQRAAEALQRITGLPAPTDAENTAEQRAAAGRQWVAWSAARRAASRPAPE